MDKKNKKIERIIKMKNQNHFHKDTMRASWPYSGRKWTAAGIPVYCAPSDQQVKSSNANTI